MSAIRIAKNASGGIDLTVDGRVISEVLAMKFEKRGGEPGRLTLELLATSIEIDADAEVAIVKVDAR